MPGWDDLMYAGIISPKAYAKYGPPPPDALANPEAMTNPLGQMPAQQAVSDVAAGVSEPLLSAGNYLGGIMQGSQRASWPETVRNNQP